MASFLGWTLDAFDFFVLVFLIDTLAVQFHVAKSAIVETFFYTLVMRPVGALLFGLLADRYGRRKPLMLNVVFFSVIELLCGFAWNMTAPTGATRMAVDPVLRLSSLIMVRDAVRMGVGAGRLLRRAPPNLGSPS